MHILVTGMNHKMAPVAIREKFNFSPNDLVIALKKLKDHQVFSETTILSTCNRSEVFAITQDLARAEEVLVKFFQGHEADQYLYTYRDAAAITHLFEVVAGLDSMIIGEPQIAGQVKDAYQVASQNGCTKIILNRLFQHALATSKMVRTQTGISEGVLSVSFAAVELAKKIFGSLDKRSALLIGAGEMAELTAQHLCQTGIGRLLVANRTLERAEKLARQFCGRSIPFEDINQTIAGVDIVITSTEAPHYLIDRTRMEGIMARRNKTPIFLIDIAVPRNVDPQVGELYNIFLYNIDDLDGVVKQNLKKREKEAAKAGSIILAETDKFMKWLDALEISPTIARLRQTFNHIRLQELERLKPKMDRLNQEDKRLIEQLTYQYMNKLLHKPTTLLKESNNKTDSLMWADAINQLFDLANTPSDEKTEIESMNPNNHRGD